MRETVSLETRDGKPFGSAEIFTSADHYPDEIMVTDQIPMVFVLHEVRRGHLVYRLSPKYIAPATNFHADRRAS